MSINTIAITKCDNQLVIYAVQPTGSIEICNIVSGNYKAVDVKIDIIKGVYTVPVTANGVNKDLSISASVQLPAGEYSIVYTGLNWGRDVEFAFTLNGTLFNLPLDKSGNLIGAVWNKGDLNTKITVA